MRALTVDDNLDDAFLLNKALVKCGVELVELINGAEDIPFFPDGTPAQCFSNPPDLVFLDVRMPQLDGLEFARWLKADRRLKNIPIVILSGKISENERVAAEELGIDLVEEKPGEYRLLIDLVQNALRIARNKASRSALNAGEADEESGIHFASSDVRRVVNAL